jgi:3-isopropylmalate dehydrogenase
MAARTIRIAVVGGDGIGPEVVAEAVKVLKAVITSVPVETTSYDLGSQRWLRTREALPDSVLAEIAQHDAILLGAVGDPSVPSGVLERGLVLRLRFELDQYVNLRPVRLYPGVVSPLSGMRTESMDMLVVREGTEGPYIEAGGVMRKGTAGEVATQESINTAFGVGRVTRYALRRAAERPRQKLTLVHKTNVLAYAGDLWHRTVAAISAEFPQVTTDYCHMDAASMYFVTQPQRFDVIVTDNMFGDILTALGAAVAGGIGLAASASINPERTAPSLFEPVHGSAPDLAGKQLADPTAAILSAAMLCEHIGLTGEAARIEQAVADDLVERQGAWAARSTLEVGDDIVERIAG